MINGKKVLAITLARGGSKGIPRKNIKEIVGKPLIVWTIESALKSKLIDKYVVSTEDKEIKQVCLKNGSNVLNRPKELAADDISSISVLTYVCKQLKEKYDIVVVLQCTSPIRKPGLIDKCIEIFDMGNYDSLVTGYNCKTYQYGELSETRRQDVRGFFANDGNVYVIKGDLIRKGDLFGEKIGYYYASKEENIDIDNPFDFWIAKKVLEERL